MAVLLGGTTHMTASQRRCLVFTAGAVALLLASATSAQVTSRDSLGITVVETAAATARAQAGLRIAADPELQIGALDGDPAYLFSDVDHVRVMSEDRVVVVDRGTASVRFYDLTGAIVQTSGREGAGPGEYSFPDFLNEIDGDSLVIYDGLNRRFTILSSSDAGLRTIPGANVGPGGPTGFSNGQVLVRAAEPPLRPEPGPFTSRLHIRLVNLDTGATDTLGTFSRHMLAVPLASGAPLIMGAPFSFAVEIAAGAEAFFFTVPGDASILGYDWGGSLRRIIRVEQYLPALGERSFRAALAERLAGARESLRPVLAPAYEHLEPPANPKVFETLLVDSHGWLWAETVRLGRDTPPTWLLFDQEGRGRGTVHMPPDLEVTSIGDNYVAGIWRDDFEVNYVRLHRIEGVR